MTADAVQEGVCSVWYVVKAAGEHIEKWDLLLDAVAFLAHDTLHANHALSLI